MDCKPTKIPKIKKRSIWSGRDAQVLLELWAERATDLRRARRNGHIYQEISIQMDNKFSPEEVHVKIRNFTQKYREEKKEMGPSGGSPSTWKFFDAVHQIIGGNAANNAEIIESFEFETVTEVSSQTSPAIQSLASPFICENASYASSQASPASLSSQVLPPSPSPQSSFENICSSDSATTSSGKKRNYMGDVIKLVKEQNDMLKSVVEESKVLSNEVVKAIREQSETSKQFLTLMSNLIEKI